MEELEALRNELNELEYHRELVADRYKTPETREVARQRLLYLALLCQNLSAELLREYLPYDVKA